MNDRYTTPTRPNITVIGGGTGIYPVIRGLRSFDVNISTVVTMSDSGGSTGRIRDEFGFQPVGDLRQSLAALAEEGSQDWIRKILLYRFQKGNSLAGHNLGNLILTALQDMTGDTDEALDIARTVFRLEGTVIPVTKDTVDLKINYIDGSHIIGEDTLDAHVKQPKRIESVELVPETTLNPRARRAIVDADLIIIGPGDYYASLMSVLVTNGIKEAFAETTAPVSYVVNLMTRLTQTHGMTAADHVRGIEEVIDHPIDRVLMNNGDIPTAILEQYADSEEYPVEDDLSDEDRVLRADMIDSTKHIKGYSDDTHRSLLRHNSEKLRRVFRTLLDDAAIHRAI